MLANLRSAPALSAKTFGVLAVAGMVVAFSLSSTLVKRAESPGVLVAFWRMVTVSLVWNLVLLGTGRWITLRNVRQAFMPGVFFGLNLTVFFAGATHNSVANAALIGSLAPFLIVPVGAWLFAEYTTRARSSSPCSRSASRSCCSMRPRTATRRSRATSSASSPCCSSCVRRVDEALPPRHGRHAFMATICPIAAVAVLPIALAHGDVFGMSATGWTYMLILTFTSGVAAQGLMVFAQKSIQIGTIGIAQVAQPALAVVWSFLLLGEVVNERQIAGIAVVVCGLLAFVVVHQRGGRRSAAAEPLKRSA